VLILPSWHRWVAIPAGFLPGAREIGRDDLA
jgi:hypothetical protein